MVKKNKKFDIVAIGDCTIDAIIQLHEASVHCNIHHEHCQICMSFADKIPYESLTLLSAGNSNNVAVGMARLGLKSGFYGSIGNDLNGKVILDTLKKEKVDTRFMSVQNVPTNFHFVLGFQGERTILIKHQEFAYKLPAAIEDTRWIYFSSVGPKGLKLHAQIEAFLKNHPQIKMSFNPGTFQLRMGLNKLKPLLQRTEILFVNKEEAQLLMGREVEDVKVLAEFLFKQGIKTVVITDGLKGSYCLEHGNFYKIGIYPHKPVEATGAGDAFATGFTAAVMHGYPVIEAMRWGARNGASVATKIGPQAGLMHKNDMEKDLQKHKNFKAKRLA